jgi:hypothetical protein
VPEPPKNRTPDALHIKVFASVSLFVGWRKFFAFLRQNALFCGTFSCIFCGTCYNKKVIQQPTVEQLSTAENSQKRVTQVNGMDDDSQRAWSGLSDAGQ